MVDQGKIRNCELCGVSIEGLHLLRKYCFKCRNIAGRKLPYKITIRITEAQLKAYQRLPEKLRKHWREQLEMIALLIV